MRSTYHHLPSEQIRAVQGLDGKSMNSKNVIVCIGKCITIDPGSRIVGETKSFSIFVKIDNHFGVSKIKESLKLVMGSMGLMALWSLWVWAHGGPTPPLCAALGATHSEWSCLDKGPQPSCLHQAAAASERWPRCQISRGGSQQ